MFTGIVEETGRVESIQPGPASIRLQVSARLCARGLKVGDSLAVNGCCLTVVKTIARRGGKILSFDLLKETWDRTNLQFAQPGSKVNLERSLTPRSRMGGHFVTGHIDGLGRIKRLEKVGKDYVLDVTVPAALSRYLIPKGSVAVDGISLTVAEVRARQFRVWIIPHTWEVTALSERVQGDSINIETDMLGKYVEKFLGLGTKSGGKSAT